MILPLWTLHGPRLPLGLSVGKIFVSLHDHHGDLKLPLQSQMALRLHRLDLGSTFAKRLAEENFANLGKSMYG